MINRRCSTRFQIIINRFYKGRSRGALRGRCTVDLFAQLFAWNAQQIAAPLSLEADQFAASAPARVRPCIFALHHSSFMLAATEMQRDARNATNDRRVRRAFEKSKCINRSIFFPVFFFFFFIFVCYFCVRSR